MKTKKEIWALWQECCDLPDAIAVEAFYHTARNDGIEEVTLLFPAQWPYGDQVAKRIRALKEKTE